MIIILFIVEYQLLKYSEIQGKREKMTMKEILLLATLDILRNNKPVREELKRIKNSFVENIHS